MSGVNALDSANIDAVRSTTRDASPPKADVRALVSLTDPDMVGVNALITERMQSDVPTIPALADHLIAHVAQRRAGQVGAQ